VARSLIQRDGPITGMDLARAQQLWWRHNLEPLQTAPAALPLAVVDFGAWFSQPEQQLDRVLALIPELAPSVEQRHQALALIRPEHRRSLVDAAVLPLHRRVRRLHQQLLASPAAHQRRWPSPHPPAALERALAAAFPDPAQLAAEPEAWSRWLNHWRHHPALRYPGVAALSEEVLISFCGATHHSWWVHLWIQRLPIPALAAVPLPAAPSDPHSLRISPAPGQADAGGLVRCAINLELPPPERAQHWLSHLRLQQVIWDPEPARVLLLRALGLPAHWLDPAAAANGWLQQPAAADPSCWAAVLGLAPPQPAAAIVFGPAGSDWDRALAAEAAAASASPTPEIAYLPGWPELIATDTVSAMAQAGWLAAAADAAAVFIWMGSAPDRICSHLPVRQWLFQPPLTPTELRAELVGEPLQALAEDRPSPPLETLFSWEASQAPEAAVLVSLFNYGSRIAAALNSVTAQRCTGLELIVVDDASADDGAAVVRAWMQAQVDSGNHPFVRLVLLGHQCNTGLAAARNSAFAAAQAPWCFVLDADNALYPNAMQACLHLARAGDEHLAVVHPLLAVDAEPGRPDEQRTLVRPQSWQRERFRFENNVDAMALVRRSAWQAVGGYTHIEGGWEDYDFWCKLVAAGYHGLQCPQVLAVYRSHAASMSHTATNRNWRSLSRTLQARHPWLQLPLARAAAQL